MTLPNCYRCGKQPCECKDGITLYHADCRDVLPLIEKGSVDCVVTDPPYGARRPSAWRLDADRFDEIVGNDAVDGFWISPLFKAIADCGASYSFCTWDTLEQWRRLLSASFRVRSCIVWDKEIHGLADLQTCWAPRHEMILFAAKGRHEFHGRRPADVIRCTRVLPERLSHPYEKPIELVRVLLQASCRACVLDPFAGSGTTLRAAKDLGRRAIGIEIEERYCQICAERLRQEVLF